jgi:hypothetical protein
MPKQTAKSSLGKLLKEHADTPVEQPQDFSKLPGGIRGGIARLVDARLGTYKEDAKQGKGGKQFIYLAGTVLRPKKVVEVTMKWNKSEKRAEEVSRQEVDVEGLRTSQTLALCETVTGTKEKPKTTSQSDNVAKALNEIKLLDGEALAPMVQMDGDPSEEESTRVLEAILKQLKKDKPYFRFKTETPEPSEDFQNPFTFERWLGNEGLDVSAVNGQMTSAPAVEIGGEASGPSEETEPPEDKTDEPDLDELAKVAAGKGQVATDAGNQLQEIAKAAGYDQDDIDNADDWDAVVAMIKGKKKKSGPDEDESEEEKEDEDEGDKERVIAKEEVYKYKPFDQKTKKRLKAVQVEVESVDKKKKTATVRNLDTSKMYKDVAWSELEDVES